jgi:hypothetical protein
MSEPRSTGNVRIDSEVLKKAKVVAAEQGWSLKYLLEKALYYWAQDAGYLDEFQVKPYRLKAVRAARTPVAKRLRAPSAK